ncbi:MAG: CpsD/CapB family tyrosine-protein kinase, partial [Oscillospiraceae bacterium]|nr:CpsD/CapB family tyrosine-protein kinase [Oscillospiraceae bacterium]
IDSINGPTIPEQPSNAASRSSLLKLSGPLGAACMCVLLVMMSIRADTVQTVSGAKRQVDGNLLATIYHERNRLPWRERMKHKKKAILITDPTCSFYYTETIHQIRVQIERARETKQQQVFVVASCSENEGKSTVAANLALSLAQKHRKVLLVDADMRKPAQQLIFETEVQRGKDFAALLSRGASPAALKEIIRYDAASNLHTLYTTPVHRKQVEALSKETLSATLDALREEFSYIIIDTPPIGFFADAEVIADVADASILVIRQDVAPSIVINDAIDNLSDSESTFLGYVFNNVRSFRAFSFRSGTYEYGYGYGYSYSYGKSDGKQAAHSSSRSRKGGRSHG